MDTSQINSHDKFFKSLFSRKEEVSEFVAKTFPPKLVANLDLSTLEPDQTEYVDEKLKTTFSDVVYNCTYGKSTQIKISLLFEHKSYPEKYPHFQLLGYMLNLWQTQIKQKQELTPIIPIIFYHGQKKWQQKSFCQYFKGIDDDLKSFIPQFYYKLIDTSNYTDKEIKALFENLELQIGLLIMKNIYNEQKILKEITDIFSEVNNLLQTEQGELFFEQIVSYLYYSTEIETPKFVEKMRTISPKAEKKFISTAMRLQMKGKAEGREEGRTYVAFSMLQEGLPDSIILKVTNLTKEQLDLLKNMKEYKLD